MRTLLLTTLVIALGTTSFLAAQEYSFAVPVVMKNNGTGTDAAQDTVWIGLHPAATYGIDAALGEEEQPPAPPSGVFDLRSVNISGHPAETPMGMGEGLALDLRDYTGSIQRDTFRLRFQPGDGGFPVTVTWPADLEQYARTLTIKPQGGEVADMLTTTSLVITDDAATNVTIIRDSDPVAGVENLRGVASSLSVVPQPARRSQGSTLRYTLLRPAHVTVALYSSAGRHLSTLIDREQTASQHALPLDLHDLSTGSYLCVVEVDGRTVKVPLVVAE